MPEILVLEIVRADLHRPARGLKLAAHRLEIPDQLALLGIDRDRRLTGRDRGSDHPVDLLELRITIRMLGALACLLIRLQAVTLGLQQPQNRAIDDIVAHLAQRFGELRAALRSPPQRRLRIPTRHRINKPLQSVGQPSLALQDPWPSCPRPPDPPPLQPPATLEL